MFRKTLSVMLALCAVFCMLLPAAAAAQTGPVSITVHSDIAGCTENDLEKLITVDSGEVIPWTHGGVPVSIAQYAGGSPEGALEPGRTYYIYFTFEAAEGYELPETAAGGWLTVACDKGVELIRADVVNMSVSQGNPRGGTVRALRIYAEVVAQGSTFQRILGWIKDIIDKIRAWSLY